MIERLKTYFRMSGTDTIYERYVVGFRDGNEHELLYETGGWNPVGSCYFTAEQCAKAHGLENFKLKSREVEVDLFPVAGDQRLAVVDKDDKVVRVGCHTFPFSDIDKLYKEIHSYER